MPKPIQGLLKVKKYGEKYGILIITTFRGSSKYSNQKKQSASVWGWSRLDLFRFYKKKLAAAGCFFRRRVEFNKDFDAVCDLFPL